MNIVGGADVETARISLGLTAAVVVPWGLGWQRVRPGATAAFTALYGAYVISPYTSDGRAWCALVAATLLSFGAIFWHFGVGSPSFGFSVVFPVFGTASSVARRLGAGAIAASAILSLWIAGPNLASLGSEVTRNDQVAVFTSALLLSVFGGGILAMLATRQVRREIDALPSGPEKAAALEFMNGGSGIGLLERGLLFAFLAAGQPEAAALVLAAKSLARIPSLDHGRHASEYFLVGTLASVIASLAMSMVARVIVGLPVL
ncbi:hypothetical protein GCM10011583_27230 [Streptomyces camponoticapitis]|uniref:Integral membrane protein n=1 Tax=Streptomyces camponoticapitis TaxID=1616125 RepID=A0ABQ2E4N9_9ACTN|nr:hypothetical protein [Streptomyces camponoticapitis]GGJ94308.1 hypothetical protein GCM10011583_27230 [Streptomyces camponoticapitis]